MYPRGYESDWSFTKLEMRKDWCLTSSSFPLPLLKIHDMETKVVFVVCVCV